MEQGDASPVSQETSASGWFSLPNELAYMILMRPTGMKDRVYRQVIFRFVCKQWRDLVPLPMTFSLTGRKDFNCVMISKLAGMGYLSVVKWAREQGCHWDHRTSSQCEAGRGVTLRC